MFSSHINFDETDLDNIVHYEYKSAKYTPIDNVLRKLTQLTVPYIPNSWSPNGITLFGPHRDDFSFYLNNNNLKVYGSQGQQRIAVLSLKLSEIEIFKKYKNTTKRWSKIHISK